MITETDTADANQLARDINRFAGLVGNLNPTRTVAYDSIATTRMDFLDCSMVEFVNAFSSAEGQETIRIKCRHCETMIECRRIVSPFVACDPCIARVKNEQLVKMYKEYWEQDHVCPANYRNTDTKHADFPKAIWADLKAKDKATPDQSYFLFGPSGTGKTRVAFLLLKAALFRGKKVGVLWPEKLEMLKSRFDTRTMDRYAEYDTLLLDDTLLTACLDSKLVNSVKELVDIRMRNKRPMIVTSQIGGNEVKGGKQFGEAKAADIERVDALIRRLREACHVTSFAKAAPGAGESTF